MAEHTLTAVDFYEVRGRRWELALCEAVERLHGAAERICVRASSEAHARALDDLLWTFREGSFVPHRLWQGEEHFDEPVAVGWLPGNPNGATSLVLACHASLEELAAFRRAVDFVPADVPDLLEKARQRYRTFQNAGLPLTFHRAPA